MEPGGTGVFRPPGPEYYVWRMVFGGARCVGGVQPGSQRMFVRFLTGEVVCVSVTSSHTIGEVRMLIAARTGIAPDYQRLIFVGKQLEDGYTVTDYDIQVEDTVHLLFRDPTDCRETVAEPEPEAVSDIPSQYSVDSALHILQRVRGYDPALYEPEPGPRQIGVASETAYVENWTVENVDGWLAATVGTVGNVVRDLGINGLTMVLMPPADFELLGYDSSGVDTILAKLLEVPSCTRGDSGGMKLYEDAWALKQRRVRTTEARADTPTAAGPAKRRAVDGRSMKDKLGGYIGDDGETRYFCAGCSPGVGLGPRSSLANGGKGWTVVKGSSHPLLKHWDSGVGNCNRDYHVMQFSDKDYTNVFRVEWEACVKFGLLPGIPPPPSGPPPLQRNAVTLHIITSTPD